VDKTALRFNSGNWESRYTDCVGQVTTPRVLFSLLAAGFAAAALYHLAALTIPAFAKMAYSPSYPQLRHIVFVFVDILAASLFLWRPRWFIWPYLALTIQILQGHGVHGWQSLHYKHQLDWIDVITVFGALLGLILLLFDRIAGKRRELRLDLHLAKTSSDREIE
jgi:hypothetical protein